MSDHMFHEGVVWEDIREETNSEFSAAIHYFAKRSGQWPMNIASAFTDHRTELIELHKTSLGFRSLSGCFKSYAEFVCLGTVLAYATDLYVSPENAVSIRGAVINIFAGAVAGLVGGVIQKKFQSDGFIQKYKYLSEARITEYTRKYAEAGLN